MDKEIFVVGYARVSTAKQAIGGDSLSGQADDIRIFCQTKGYTLFPQDKVFEEPYTGKVSIRPIYSKIIELIKNNPGKIKFFIVRIISRMTRGEVAKYYEMKDELKRYGVQLRDVSGIIQEEQNHFEKYGLDYEWAKESPSETSELMEVKRSEIDRKRVLRQLIEAQIILVRDGYHMGPAGDGYISKRVDVDMKKRYVLEPDPSRAHFFIEMFNLRAEGVYSDEEIVDKINAMGFKSKSRKKWDPSKTKVLGKTLPLNLTIKTLQRVISRPTYCGVVCEKWTNYLPVRGKWKGLVSVDVFNKANRGKVQVNNLPGDRLEILYNQNPEKLLDKRHNFRKEFPYKNVLMCLHCGSPLHASPSTGKSGKGFVAYHCTRGHKRYAISQKKVEEAFSGYLSKIKFTDEFISILERVLVKKYQYEEGTVADRSKQISKHTIELQDQKQMKLRAIETTNSLIVKADLEKEYENIHLEILRSQAERNRLEVTEDEIHQFINYSRDLMEHPAEILANIENKQEQVALYSLFFERFPTYEEIISGTPKLTFIFKLNEEKLNEESLNVRRQGIEP